MKRTFMSLLMSLCVGIPSSTMEERENPQETQEAQGREVQITQNTLSNIDIAATLTINAFKNALEQNKGIAQLLGNAEFQRLFSRTGMPKENIDTFILGYRNLLETITGHSLMNNFLDNTDRHRTLLRKRKFFIESLRTLVGLLGETQAYLDSLSSLPFTENTLSHIITSLKEIPIFNESNNFQDILSTSKTIVTEKINQIKRLIRELEMA